MVAAEWGEWDYYQSCTVEYGNDSERYTEKGATGINQLISYTSSDDTHYTIEDCEAYCFHTMTMYNQEQKDYYEWYGQSGDTSAQHSDYDDTVFVEAD